MSRVLARRGADPGPAGTRRCAAPVDRAWPNPCADRSARRRWYLYLAVKEWGHQNGWWDGPASAADRVLAAHALDVWRGWSHVDAELAGAAAWWLTLAEERSPVLQALASPPPDVATSVGRAVGCNVGGVPSVCEPRCGGDPRTSDRTDRQGPRGRVDMDGGRPPGRGGAPVQGGSRIEQRQSRVFRQHQARGSPPVRPRQLQPVASSTRPVHHHDGAGWQHSPRCDRLAVVVGARARSLHSWRATGVFGDGKVDGRPLVVVGGR